jgi:hypothetical protein
MYFDKKYTNDPSVYNLTINYNRYYAMTTYLAFLCGFVIKAYDDLNDNPKLEHFKTDFIMEVLKGIQYISLTTLSIDEPLFFYIMYIGNVLNSLTNQEGFKDPYEHSLLYSYPILFLMLWRTPFSKLGLMDWAVIWAICAVCLLEPIIVKYLFQNEESSFSKLIIRLIGCILECWILFIGVSPPVKYFISCALGYCGLSACVQIYSVFVAKEPQSVPDLPLIAIINDDPLELGTLELGTLELGPLELGPLELGTLELGTLELGTLELGTLELGTLELDPNIQHNILSSPTVEDVQSIIVGDSTSQ